MRTEGGTRLEEVVRVRIKQPAPVEGMLAGASKLKTGIANETLMFVAMK